MGRGSLTPERTHTGSFWWSRWGGVPEHQNEPTRAHSGGRDEGEETEHQNMPTRARSGVRNVWRVRDGNGERRRGGVMPNTKSTPTWACFCCSARCGEGGTCPTAKTRPKGRAFAIRRYVERERAQQQKHTQKGVFLAFATTWRGKGVPNSTSTPLWACL